MIPTIDAEHSAALSREAHRQHEHIELILIWPSLA
jgi:hypothetical protein